MDEGSSSDRHVGECGSCSEPRTEQKCGATLEDYRNLDWSNGLSGVHEIDCLEHPAWRATNFLGWERLQLGFGVVRKRVRL